MKWFRMIRRSLLLIVHVFGGILINLFTKRSTTINGESLPDPELVSRWLQRVCRILDLELVVSGSRPHARALLVANHVSWLDVPVLGALTHSGFLSKDSIRKSSGSFIIFRAS